MYKVLEKVPLIKGVVTLPFFFVFFKKKVAKMLGQFKKKLYFCGVKEWVIVFKDNETFFETFCSNACIYENFSLSLHYQNKQIIAMEKYRKIRRYGVDEKYLITFQNENGENFFVNNKFKFIPITNKTSCEEIRTNAKWYSQRGVKVVVTKLWNNRSLGIKKSKYCTLKHLEETFRIYRAYDIRC